MIPNKTESNLVLCEAARCPAWANCLGLHITLQLAPEDHAPLKMHLVSLDADHAPRKCTWLI